MSRRPCGLRVLDLFSGAGGFSEGFRQAGFDVVAGIDNWAPARETHHVNGLGEAIDFDMLEAIGAGGYEKAKQLVSQIEQRHGRIDVLIGSPPCTEFSYAKKGGRGDIARGMLLVRAFLVFVAALKPKFWFMENVPRLKHAIQKESEKTLGRGWAVPLARLGVSNDFEDIPWVKDDYLHVPFGDLLLASDFGAPQNRTRFIAGNFAAEDINRHKVAKAPTLGEILGRLGHAFKSKDQWIADPNYSHHRIKRDDLRDYDYDTRVHPMYWEEMRYLKRRHIQYGRMDFPDDLNRTARTIMATYNTSSREAITLDTGETIFYQGKNRPVFRQPTVREVACLQGFPLNFQFDGSSVTTRYKLVGNAVPCQLAYALALTILDRFEGAEFKDDGWKSRFEETLRSRESNRLQPIIQMPSEILAEAGEANRKRPSFRARDDKNIRRKILSSKPQNSSFIVIMENTAWIDEGKRTGGLWKSCIQMGVGQSFSQVYLDNRSVDSILSTIDASPEVGRWKPSHQMTLDGKALRAVNRKSVLQRVLHDICSEIDAGIPRVSENWNEFPGYGSQEAARYLTEITAVRLALPAASRFQYLFTHDASEIGRVIGPVDFFDGIDAIMLRNLSRTESDWILQTTINFDDLRDDGEVLYKKRISPNAFPFIKGKAPLVTLVAALMSVHALYRMHSQDAASEDPFFRSLEHSWQRIQNWKAGKPYRST